MAILDRPLFQRRPTMDQLRMYGLPAFANGGVVQRFQNGGQAGDIIKTEFIERDGDIIKRTTKLVEQARTGKLIERVFEEVVEPGTQTQVSKNPRDPKKDEEKEVGGQSSLKLATEMEEGAENVAKSARPSEAIVSDTVERRQEELAESGFAASGDERNKLTELENLVKQRSDLYKKILGDPKEQLKQQGLLQLAQFGLNLASARGGTFAEKIAKSAKDPLQAFAALGRESLKDERAIEMLAIKGAEDELARTQKTGTFGQLVQDIMKANPKMDLEEAYAKSIEITSQKAGKSLQEQRNEYSDKLVDLYVKEEGLEVEEATNRANKKALERFPNPDEEKTISSVVTITGKNDPAYDKLQPGEQYIFEGTTYTKKG
tara:strand:- start:226 stop:1350 length:1125 start_codon:yes stop_codon:yes gene_type:complete